ncbi:MAG: hypothetical protein XD72_0917, partial [Methanothrix harundinacea]
AVHLRVVELVTSDDSPPLDDGIFADDVPLDVADLSNMMIIMLYAMIFVPHIYYIIIIFNFIYIMSDYYNCFFTF